MDQDQQIALSFASGSGDACEWSKVEWLSLDNTTGTIDVKKTLKGDMDAARLLNISEDI